ncbi:MAG: ComEC/Rec2 family competence protein, partial [Acidimicrobiia bacterium]
IMLGDARGAGSASLLLAGALVGLGAAFVGRNRRGAVVCAVVAMVALGAALEQRALHGLARSPLTADVDRHASGEATFTLTEDPDGPQYQSSAIARFETLRDRDAGGRSVLVIASGDNLSALSTLDAGDRVRATGTLAPLSGYARRNRWRHAVAQFRLSDVAAASGPSDPWFQLANVARRSVLRGTTVLPATPRALLSGFLLGDTRSIPDLVVQDFRDAGLSHLLAVSGANVAFALAMVEPALRRLRRGSKFAAGVGVLVLFGTMTRWEPSVLRAAVMAGLVMLARAAGRPADAKRVLVLAMTGLLIADPFLLRSIGFLLSCGACAGIVTGSSAIAARLRGPEWFREALGVTTAAQIGVAPVLLATFGTLPLIALPANLVAAPFVGPLTVWGLVAGLVGGVLGPRVAFWFQLPSLSMLRAIEWIAHTSAKVPVAVDGPWAGALGGVVVVVVVGTRVWRHCTGRIDLRGRRVSREGQRSTAP